MMNEKSEVEKSISEKLTADKLTKKSFNFDKELKKLISESKEIMELKNPNRETIIPECLFMNQYLNIYNKMKPEEHFQYFEIFYGSKREKILNTLIDDEWLKIENINIQFGQGLKLKNPKLFEQHKIPLSSIYRTACSLREMEMKKREEYGDDYLGSNPKNLIRPQIFNLHFMRIFLILNSGSDLEALEKNVSELEDLLQVSFINRVSKSKREEEGPKGFEGNEENPLGSVIKNLMGNKDINGKMIPTIKEGIDMMQKIMENKGIQEIMQNFSEKLRQNQGEDFNSSINNIINMVTSPETSKILQNSLKESSESLLSENRFKVNEE